MKLSWLAALVVAWALLCVAPAGLYAAQPSPHVPTEQQLDEEISGVHADETGRGYQRRAVETVQSWYADALTWLSDLLRRIYLTPARLAIGLGVIGIIYTAGKNKRKVYWAVLTVTSFLLAVFGVCAAIFDWPYCN